MTSGVQVDRLSTGAGVISSESVRFGKGHGFLTWSGMLYSIGAVNKDVPCGALVHESQVLEEEMSRRN